MFKNFHRFSALTLQEKKLFLEAYVILLSMRIALGLFSFKRLTKTLQVSTAADYQTLFSESQLTMAKAVGKAIQRAAGHTPWKSTCLVQSLTAWKMLKKRGIAGALYLGALKEGKGNREVKAHAWTQCGDTFITGETVSDKYKRLVFYRWSIETNQD